jgi:hypothetical protein
MLAVALTIPVSAQEIIDSDSSNTRSRLTVPISLSGESIITEERALLYEYGLESLDELIGYLEVTYGAISEEMEVFIYGYGEFDIFYTISNEVLEILIAEASMLNEEAIGNDIPSLEAAGYIGIAPFALVSPNIVPTTVSPQGGGRSWNISNSSTSNNIFTQHFVTGGTTATFHIRNTTAVASNLSLTIHLQRIGILGNHPRIDTVTLRPGNGILTSRAVSASDRIFLQFLTEVPGRTVSLSGSLEVR